MVFGTVMDSDGRLHLSVLQQVTATFLSCIARRPNVNVRPPPSQSCQQNQV
ncbi:hypothetical protein DPMN_091531 [Dreissena polymorpha]|uniref:Uncharacterized protein n=1 Tax=Dreissena polymorpha TaxID=45954 RepID=A0A9D4R0T3_DREPO|nr:hypothetical protein DPMN_091531 [Dreissena polymorpha]